MSSEIENLFQPSTESDPEQLRRDLLALVEKVKSLEAGLGGIVIPPATDLSGIRGEIDEVRQQVTNNSIPSNLTDEEEESFDERVMRLNDEYWRQLTQMQAANASPDGVTFTRAIESARASVEELAAKVTAGSGTQVQQIFAIKKTQRTLAAALLRLTAQANELSAFAEALLIAQAQLETQGSDIVSIADAALLLQAEVENIDGEVQANATAILGINATLADALISAYLSFNLESPPPAGVLVQVNLRAKAQPVGGSFVDTGMSIQLYEESPGVIKSRISFIADNFLVGALGSDTPLFAVAGGAIRLNAPIKLGTDNIDFGAVGNIVVNNIPGEFTVPVSGPSNLPPMALPDSVTWYNAGDVTITIGSANKVLVQFNFEGHNGNPTQYVDVTAYFRIRRGSTTIKHWLGRPNNDVPPKGYGTFVSGYGTTYALQIMDEFVPAGTHTYYLDAISNSAVNPALMKSIQGVATELKR